MERLAPGSYYPPLTGIRAVAAYLIFAYHFNPFSLQSNALGYHVVNEWHVGVSMFFVLSGVLITLRYDRDATFHWKPYLVNRFARIFPLYFVLVTFTFLFWYYSGSEQADWYTYLANVTLLKAFSDSHKFTGIAQSWSLTVEESFYLLAPIIFWLGRKGKLLLQPLILLGSVLLLLSWQGALGNWDRAPFVLIYTFAGRFFEFYVGIFVARMLMRQSLPLKGFSYTLGGAIGILLCLAALTYVALPYHDSFESPAGTVINLVLLPSAFGLFYYGLLKESSWVSCLLGSRPMQLAGKMSYAFYLVHLGVFYTLFSSYVNGNAIAYFLFANGLAFVLYQWVEQPLNRWLRIDHR